MTARLTSSSEVAEFLKCETLWKFKYHPEYRLAELSNGPAAQRGITGHKGIEVYFNKRVEGLTHETATKFVESTLMEASMEAFEDGDADTSKMLMELSKLLKDYFNHYESDFDDWEILGTEIKVEDPSFNFVGRIDLLIRYRNGPHTGMVVPVDHKFLYNFWNDKAFKFSAQAANYIRAVRAMYPNEMVPHLLFNEVRFRADAKERYFRKELVWEPIKHANITQNHVITSRKIDVARSYSREEANKFIPRALVKTTCEYCRFDLICNAELSGQDTAIIEKINYRPNEYGYDNDDDTSE